MATDRLDILITAKNNASAAIKQVGTDLKGLDNAAKTVSQGLSGLLPAAGLAGIGILATQIGQAGIAASQAAISFDALSTSFENLTAQSGQNADAMLSALRQASQGMISDANLILAANRAMMLGVADSTDELVTLMQIAAEKGQAFGLTMTQAFDDLVTGLGRGSALILDNLGITFNATEVNEAYAESIGKVAEELTEAEKKQALINFVVSEGASGAEVAVNPYQQLAAATDNFRIAVGQWINEATPWPALLEEIAGGIQGVTNAMDASVQADMAERIADMRDLLTLQTQGLTQQIAIMQDAALAGDVPGMEEAATHIQTLRTQIQQLGQNYNELARQADFPLVDLDQLQQGIVSFYNMELAIQAVGDAALDAAADIDQINIAAVAATENFNALVAVTTQYRNAVAAAGSRLVDEMGPQGALGWIEQQNEAVKAQVDLWEEQGFTTRQIGDVLLPNYLSGLQDVTKELDTSSQAVRRHAAEVPRVSEAYRNLEQTIASVLGSALDVSDIGSEKIIEDILGRPDAINEDARRLADVAVKGWESPWVEYFRSEFPGLWAEAFRGTEGGGDIQKQAAELLRQFELGLRPELIDKEMAKERVRQLLLGDQNLASLAQEIAEELATELGIPLYEALQRTRGALGVGGADELGAGAGDLGRTLGDSAVAQIEESNSGVAVVDTFVSQMRNVFGRIEQAGKDAGAVWGKGFQATVEANVPPGLVDMLVNLVTPGVAAGLTRQETLRAAQ